MTRGNFLNGTRASNQALQLTASRGDDQLEFMKQIVDLTKARSRQR
jgi:hypothetical protein